MTYAAVFTLATLASQYTLTEEEIATALRTARATGVASITVQAVEDAIATVVAGRGSHAA